MGLEWLQNKNLNEKSTIVHLGAGRCSELPAYCDGPAGQILLIESDDRVVQDLRDKVSRHERIQVIQATVAAEAKQRTCYGYSYPVLNGLCQATGADSFFPGLRLKSQVNVDAVTLADSLQGMNIDPAVPNLLFVDLPCEGDDVVRAAHEAGLLTSFSAVLVRQANPEFYSGQHSADGLVSVMRNAGYLCLEVDKETDPDFFLLTFSLDHEAIAERNRQQKVAFDRQQEAEQEQQRQQQEDALKQALAEVQHLRVQQDEQTRQWEEVSRAKADLVQKYDQLKTEFTELVQKRDEAVQQRDQQAGLATERQQKIGELNQTRENLSAANEHNEELTINLKAEQESAIQLSVQVHKLTTELNEKEADFEQNHQDMAIALRMKSVRDSDLKDLQLRYSELLKTKERQEVLLRKLTERLSLAAAYLVKLESSAGEHSTSSQALVGDLVEAFSGSPE